MQKLGESVRTLLNTFCYGMTTGVRWIPTTAVPLFEAARASLSVQKDDIVGALFKEEVEDLISARREEVRKDCTAMYREINPGGGFRDEQHEKVLDEVKRRAEYVKRKDFLPRVTYQDCPLPSAAGYHEGDPLAAYAKLLTEILRLPGLALTDRYFERRLPDNTESYDYMKAMRVIDDPI